MLDERSNKKSANSDDSGVETSSCGNESGDGPARSSEDEESDESRPGSAMILNTQRPVPIVKGNINLGPSERP